MKRAERAGCGGTRPRLNASFGGDFETALLGGFKFVRQEPIGPYFADFVCREEKLIVDPRTVIRGDGATHSTDDERRRDDAREHALRDRGYCVARFHNDEVYRNIEGVLETILAALERRQML